MNTALSPSRDLRLARVGVLLGVLTLLALAYHSGVLHRFMHPAEIARTLRELGAWGYLVFVLSYAALQPFGVPGTAFIVAAPLIWPWPVAFALSMVGTMAASVIGFAFARFVARAWLTRKIPARFLKYDDALAARAFSTVFWLRLVFWMPQWLHTILGISKVPFWTHFWASVAGYTVPVLLVSFFGQKLFDWLKTAPPSAWLLTLVSSALVLLSAWFIRRRARAANSVADAP